MSAISEMSFPIDHLCLRSLLPRNQQIRVPDSSRRRRAHHELPALRLAVHLAATSLLFLALVIAVWMTSWAFHSLQSLHPLPNEFLRLLDRLEIWLVYLDGTLICGTLLFGSGRYFLDIVRGRS